MKQNRIEDIKSIVTIKLGDKANEILVSFAIEEAIESIKNYCNIEDVPDALSYIIANFAIDIVDCDLNIISEGTVKSVARGDTNITYVDKKITDKGNIINNYSKRLNNYRKIRWS